MRVLIDTNVILDIALERKPFVQHAALLLETAQQKGIQLFITATTVTDLCYRLSEKGFALSTTDPCKARVHGPTWATCRAGYEATAGPVPATSYPPYGGFSGAIRPKNIV